MPRRYGKVYQRPQLSSPAKAGDPVFQRRKLLTEKPRRTGSPGQAGRPELCLEPFIARVDAGATTVARQEEYRQPREEPRLAAAACDFHVPGRVARGAARPPALGCCFGHLPSGPSSRWVRRTAPRMTTRRGPPPPPAAELSPVRAGKWCGPRRGIRWSRPPAVGVFLIVRGHLPT